MRIHTNLLRHEIGAAIGNSGAPIRFHAEPTEHRSTQRARAFEVRLEGTGGFNNTGYYGAGDYNGATWDEWGAFFGALYELDPTAICGGTKKRPVYASVDDFHHQTGGRFRPRLVPTDGPVPTRSTHMPADTHPRHRWVNAGPGDWSFVCAKSGCSATMPSWTDRHSHRAA